jgi:isopentenyldiphosphate isomerase
MAVALAVHSRDEDLHVDLGAIERAVTTVLGLAQYGVHANLFVDPCAPPDQANFWLAQRSATKATWPSCWDTAVAGGLAYREAAHRCMERECAEEAGVSEAVAARDLRAASAVSFCCRYAADGTRGLFSDNDYVFDLRVPHDFVPTPADGEVHKFERVSAEELLRRITRPRSFPFLPSALLACVDLLCRLGYVGPHQEPRDYFDVLRALRTAAPTVDLEPIAAQLIY